MILLGSQVGTPANWPVDSNFDTMMALKSMSSRYICKKSTYFEIRKILILTNFSWHIFTLCEFHPSQIVQIMILPNFKLTKLPFLSILRCQNYSFGENYALENLVFQKFCLDFWSLKSHL